VSAETDIGGHSTDNMHRSILSFHHAQNGRPSKVKKRTLDELHDELGLDPLCDSCESMIMEGRAEEEEGTHGTAAPPVQSRASLALREAIKGRPSPIGRHDYDLAMQMYTISNRVTRRAADSMAALIKSCPGTWHCYEGVCVPWGGLELAGEARAAVDGQDHTEYQHRARRLAQQACPERCGPDGCKGSCRVGSFVIEPNAVRFYFGRQAEVRNALCDSSASTVYVLDEVTLDRVARVDAMLLANLKACGYGGLSMQAIALKSVPGLTLYRCNIAQWIKFCIEVICPEVNLEYKELQVRDAKGCAVRAYGAPNTTQWQKEIEEHRFPGGRPNNVYIVGIRVALDVSHLTADQQRKQYPWYAAPSGVEDEAAWPPVMLMPIHDFPVSPAGQRQARLFKDECLRLFFADHFDGKTYIPIKYRGEQALVLLALQELLVDGKDAAWLARVRMNGMFGCARCRLSNGQWGQCGQSDARRAMLERTVLDEQRFLQTARVVQRQPRSITKTNNFLMLEGLVDTVDNPLWSVFGVMPVSHDPNLLMHAHHPNLTHAS
jgi:hypothetical protein